MKLPDAITVEQLQAAAKALGLDMSGLIDIRMSMTRIKAVYHVKDEHGRPLVINGEVCFQEFDIPLEP